jgi:hypothetical protein
VLRVLGIGALVAGGVAVAVLVIAAVVLLGPLIFWIAWNVLDFAHAVGLPELGFWGIVLATLFLVTSWPSRCSRCSRCGRTRTLSTANAAKRAERSSRFQLKITRLHPAGANHHQASARALAQASTPRSGVHS